MKVNQLTKFNKGISPSILALFYSILFLITSHSLFSQSFTFEKEEDTIKSRLNEVGHKFVELLNHKSEVSAIALSAEIFKQSSASDWATSFRKEYGEVELGRIRTTIGDDFQTVHVIVKVRKTQDWKNFQIVFGNETPKRSGRINIVLAAKPMSPSPGKISNSKVQAELNAYMDELELENKLFGSVLIKKGDETILDRVFGMANQETGRKNTAKTPFNLASGGKMFTAVAILKLVQEGKVNLEDSMSKFIPDYPDEAFAKKVTIANLLSHTSGLGDYWDDEFEKHWNEIKTLKHYVPFIAKQPLKFDQPGQGSYSNSGFILLGLIIEKASGDDYYEYIRQNIFDPLGMDNTDFHQKSNEDIIAIGYLDLDKDNSIRARGANGKGSSAGGVYSTTADMFKFRTALLNHRLVNKSLLDEATSTQAVLEGGMHYGYGFTLNEGFANSFGHGGRGPGSSTAFDVDKDSDYTFIAMSNNVNGAFSELFFTLKEVLKR